jgi:hypothetical protein
MPGARKNCLKSGELQEGMDFHMPQTDETGLVRIKEKHATQK